MSRLRKPRRATPRTRSKRALTLLLACSAALSLSCSDQGLEGSGGESYYEPPANAAPSDPSASSPDSQAPEGEGGSERPRVRKNFPETLDFRPAVITDTDGHAVIDVALADNITTWRISGLANSREGQLGSGVAGLTVFQDFFVDIDFPSELTQGDEVSVPVALHNYLDAAQTVVLTVDLESSGRWFELLGPQSTTVTLEPGEVTARPLRLRALEVGDHALQVWALGDKESDAVRRVVHVAPNGQVQAFSRSGVLRERVVETISIPANAIDHASKLVVKLYPGLVSQVVDGLESLLQMPGGCFEQTSSSTYPNVLVLDYLRATGELDEETEATAREYIGVGYQRLVSFEVEGGGFEWFGNGPAHRILTAYGLLEFSDMARVYEIDPAIIPRTQAWLLTQQESDGRWRAAPEGIHEGATNQFRDSDVRATAYVTYALLESGARDPGTMRGLDWLRRNTSAIDDAYTMGLLLNAFLVGAPDDARVAQLYDALLASAQTSEDGKQVWWDSDSQSLTYGAAGAMKAESTALILQALIRHGAPSAILDGAVESLVAAKSAYGLFGSTQGTVLSLRAFNALAKTNPALASGQLRVGLGAHVETFDVTPESADLMRQVDLSDVLIKGENSVSIELSGDGGFLYQIVGEYYEPWPQDGESQEGLEFSMTYEGDDLVAGVPVAIEARVSNSRQERVDMVMLSFGVPPGFDVQLRDFEAAIADPALPVSKVERRGSDVVVYLYGLDAGEQVTLRYTALPTMPMVALTPLSSAWLYYDERVRAEVAPVQLTVRE